MEVLGRTTWSTPFGRGYGTVLRICSERMNEQHPYYYQRQQLTRVSEIEYTIRDLRFL
jgi:hypothetical protein